MYCKKCGGKLESYASNCAFCGAPVEKYETKVNYIKEGGAKASNPITTWKWIGYYLLPVIPAIGSIIQLVLTIKWAFGNHDDDTLKGFARAQLIILLFAVIIFGGIIAVILANPEFFKLSME